MSQSGDNVASMHDHNFTVKNHKNQRFCCTIRDFQLGSSTPLQISFLVVVLVGPSPWSTLNREISQIWTSPSYLITCRYASLTPATYIVITVANGGLFTDCYALAIFCLSGIPQWWWCSWSCHTDISPICSWHGLGESTGSAGTGLCVLVSCIPWCPGDHHPSSAGAYPRRVELQLNCELDNRPYTVQVSLSHALPQDAAHVIHVLLPESRLDRS